jgi:hypothetical protein
MNTLRLFQKQGFTRYEYILMADTIFVKQFTIKGYKDWVVNVETLGYKTIIEKDTSFMRIGFSFSSGLFSFFFVAVNAYDHSNNMKTWLWIAIGMLYALIAIALYLYPTKNQLLLVNGTNNLEFLSDKPSEKDVHEFVDEIIRRSKEVLLRKYGNIDPDLPENLIISQLKWLLDRGVIDYEEFNIRRANYYNALLDRP